MKRIFNAIGKRTKDAKFQQKAIKKMEDIEKGEKIMAPKLPTEEKRFQSALKDDKVKELVNKKETTLVENMNKIKVTSTEPVERWTSTRDLPTRESEWMHRNDPVWEYGFYEPEEHRIPKNKLMFREALEATNYRSFSFRSSFLYSSFNARTVYEKHKAVARVDKEKLDDMWEYFRPFVRKDYQKVVSKADLAQLQEKLQGISDESSLLDSAKDGFRLELNFAIFFILEDTERKQLEEAISEQRRMEMDRLASRMKSMEEVGRQVFFIKL
uniref:28S ribosomal protein S26, mitochondrial n=1 Tax=Angiostrongylus cantonensis TaxID=6313 RepID=A0A0K0CVK7_ANGCA